MAGPNRVSPPLKVDPDGTFDSRYWDRSVPLPEGPEGPRGPEGPQGIRGPIGPEGPVGPTGEVSAAALEDRVTPIEGDVSDIDTRVTTTETVTDRLSTQRIDVRAFGAVGDGTTDYTVETAAIQAAIDTAAGRWVVIPSGTFNVDRINVTGSMRLRLEEGAVLRIRDGSTTPSLFNFTGTDLVIRGPGIIDGNQHTNQPVRTRIVEGNCEEGKSIDIEGVHFRSIMIGVRLLLFGGYLNFSGNTITDQGQHQQVSGATTAIASIASGQITAKSPLIRTNFNRAIFDQPEDAPGTAPGGFFVCTSNQPTTPLWQGNPAKWEAIGNYFYGYGQNHMANEIGCLHAYPAPAQCRFIGNHFEHFPVCPINAKSVTDFVCTDNTFLSTLTNTTYVTSAGTILYAPGYHASTAVRRRAVIANNIINHRGGTAEQGASGIVVNSTEDSSAWDVAITGNVIAVRGVGVSLSFVRNAHISDNIITSIAGAGISRGIVMNHISSDVEVVDNLIDVVDHGVFAASTTNVDARVWVKGNTIKSQSFSIDIRGVRVAAILGNSVERSAGGTAIYVSGIGGNPTQRLFFDRSNIVIAGTIVLDHPNIGSLTGQQPLGGAPSMATGAAAGSGASASSAGNGDAGVITVTTGTGTATGTLAVATFSPARRHAPTVTLTPANGAAASVPVYVSGLSSTTFALSVAGSALAESTTHQWHYRID